MGIFSRFTDIVNSNITAILDRAEDPEKLVRLMIQEMEATLVEVRSAAARAIADKKEVTRAARRLEAEAADWQARAELAIDKNRDDLAKAALAEKSRVGTIAAGLNTQREAIEEGLEQLNADIARLEEKLADAKARQRAILARHHTATHRLGVRRKIHDYRIEDALSRFEHFERRIEDLEGPRRGLRSRRKAGAADRALRAGVGRSRRARAAGAEGPARRARRPGVRVTAARRTCQRPR